MLSTILALAAPVFASPVVISPDDEATRESLYSAFQGHFTPDAAPDEHGPTCLSPLVRQLKENWHLFSDDERALMTRELAPWKADLLDPMLPAGAPPPPPGTGTPCFGDAGAYQIDSDHFSVQWDSGVDESTAQDFSDALEYAWEVEIDELGWEEPVGTPTYPMLIYIADNSREASAYTTVDYCTGVGYAPYIVAYSGSFYGGTWYMDMAAHEFQHATQYSYTYYGYDLWWWEATATWLQEYVYPSHEWWSTYTVGYADNPYIGMESSSQADADIFWHMYGMSIWAFYLDEYVGGHDFVQDTWKYALSSGRSNLWMPQVLSALDEEFDERYIEFMAANTVMAYDEYRYYPDIDLADDIDELPAEGENGRRTGPEGLGQNYIRFDKDAGEPGDILEVTFEGEDSQDWYAILVAARGHAVEEVVVILAGDDAGASGVGEIELDDINDVFLVVSPRSKAESSYDYTWSARIAEVVPEDTGGEGGGEEGGGEEGGGEEGSNTDGTKGDPGDTALDPDDGKGGVCGCASTGGGAAGLVWAFGLAGLAFRRRRA